MFTSTVVLYQLPRRATCMTKNITLLVRTQNKPGDEMTDRAERERERELDGLLGRCHAHFPALSKKRGVFVVRMYDGCGSTRGLGSISVR